MGKLRETWRELMRELRAARVEQRMLDRQMEERRFEERQARHEAGIYEPPSHGGP